MPVFAPIKPLLKAMVLFLIMAVLAIGYLKIRRRAGEAEMERLLAGDATVRLRALTINLQQREVYCTNHEALQYISRSIRASTTNNLLAGSIYHAKFVFDDGQIFYGTIYFQSGGFSISLPSRATEEEWPTAEIKFQPAVPPEIMKILDFLNAPWQQVSGTRLFLEDGKPVRSEQDSTLTPK
ncbi:MAG TPA: hypothetical protein VGG44_03190 [Tepidisphaeraceae bacterium]